MSSRNKNSKKKQQTKSTVVPKADNAAQLLQALEDGVDKMKISPRTATGVLTSQEKNRDIKVEGFSLSLFGTVLIEDTKLELNWGRRYGLLGLNGTGKSTMLKVLGEREVPLPEFMSVHLLESEVVGSDLTALEAVIEDAANECKRLEALAEELTVSEDAESDKLQFVYDCIDELEVDKIVPRAAEILHGLGFTKKMQQKKTKDFSGGWRMRIALAKALFIKPMMLLLDEPTNHLDLEACVWLEDYLKNYDRILVLISHSQDFLNGVCTNIIHLQNKKLIYYGGNFDSYIQTRGEKEVLQMKQFNWEQDQIAHMKEYIARFGHGSAKLAAQAKSKEKTLARMEEKGLTERVARDRTVTFRFKDCGTLPPPVLQFNHVHFAYASDKENEIYADLDFGIDLDSRVALVGPNGAGKSTLVKLMVGSEVPTKGMVRRHHHLVIGWFHQHLTDILDLSLTPLEWMMKEYPDEREVENVRRIVGRWGITGKDQTSKMELLSDGMKRRVCFCWLAYKEPHLLLLDEPTNHLDIETIDALADALNSWDGGLVLVSHDFRLINQVAKEIWVCERKNIWPWKGDIQSYKDELRRRVYESQD